MYRLTLVPPNTKLPFVATRFFFFGLSGFVVLASIILMLTKGLNLGVDFKGGILVEVKAAQTIDVGAMRDKLGSINLGEAELQEFGVNEVLVRLPMQEGGEKAQQATVDKVKQVLGEGLEYRRTEIVGPKVSDELFLDGMIAIALALVGILAYIWFRFEWQFGICANVALIHDVVSTIGIFSLLGFEFNLATVAAVLTIAGYSVNDTVVIFDRVRENLRKYKAMPLKELLDLSINETLSRTALTTLTVFLSVLSLFAFGGDVIRGFSFAMLWGVIVGTYSTLGVAVPLLLYMKLPATMVAKRKEEAPV